MCGGEVDISKLDISYPPSGVNAAVDGYAYT